MKIFSAASTTALLLLAHAKAAEVDIETCSDLAAAVDATSSEDTTGTIITSAAFHGEDCGEGTFKRMQLKNNHLTIVAPTLSENDQPQIWDIAFELVDGAELTIVPNVEFQFTNEENDLEHNGGFLNVCETCKARFRGFLDVRNFVVRSVVTDGDFTSDIWEGGCVYNDGYFRVDGFASFSGCDSVGGGESGPGRGGAIFNGPEGSILFKSGVLIEDTAITDNEGNSGGGIYNEGKVNIKGDSSFERVRADSDGEAGGGIYNAEGAKFTFRSGAAVRFVDATAGVGGAVYNAGEFRFSGPALFVDCASPVYNVSPGFMKLSDQSVFWSNSADIREGGAVTNRAGAELDIGDDLLFVSNTAGYSNNNDLPFCDNIYLQEAAGVWQDDYAGEVYTCYP